MGGLLKACGCYDGPRSPTDPQLVSLRCATHVDEPAAEGCAGPFHSNRTNRLIAIGRPLSKPRPKMAVPKGRRRR